MELKELEVMRGQEVRRTIAERVERDWKEEVIENAVAV